MHEHIEMVINAILRRFERTPRLPRVRERRPTYAPVRRPAPQPAH